MKIIKDQTIIEDSCTHLGDDDVVPETGKVTVSLARWQAERETLTTRTDPVGVRIAGEDNVRDLQGDLNALALIALEFPKFADGRGYSHAHILRAHMSYTGELRAVGDVLRDQIWNMSRVGINAFEVAADRSVEDALKAFTLYSVRYQSTVDQPLPIFRQ